MDFIHRPKSETLKILKNFNIFSIKKFVKYF
jgi:hypothetical protein